MSSLASPFGLRPAFHPSGVLRQLESTIVSGFLSDIYQFSPVAIDPVTGALTVVGPGNPVVGSFMGVEWTGLDGRRRVGNHWIPGTVGTNIVAYYTEEPKIIYEIQSNEPVPLSSVGLEFDFAAITGNNITGLSSVALDHALGPVSPGDCRLIGVNPATDNEFGDAFTIVQVQLSNHQYVALGIVLPPPGNLSLPANLFENVMSSGTNLSNVGIRLNPNGQYEFSAEVDTITPFWQEYSIPFPNDFWLDDGGASAAQFEAMLDPLNIGNLLNPVWEGWTTFNEWLPVNQPLSLLDANNFPAISTAGFIVQVHIREIAVPLNTVDGEAAMTASNDP